MFTSWQTYQTYQNGCILMVVTIQSLKFEFSCLCTGPPHEGGRLYTVCVCFFSDILPISVRPKAIFSDSPDISADKSNCLFTHIYHILVQHSMYVCPSVASFHLRYWAHSLFGYWSHLRMWCSGIAVLSTTSLVKLPSNVAPQVVQFFKMTKQKMLVINFR